MKYPLTCLTGVLALVLGSEPYAQRQRRVRVDPPLQQALPGLPDGGSLEIEGDTPLTELARFAGRVDVFVQALPFPGPGATTGGTFTVSGIPAGATILRAWMLVTSFAFSADQPVSLDFTGDFYGPHLPDVQDPGNFLFCSLYRFDVTGSVSGNGLYAYEAVGHDNHYGDAFIVVYEHPSLPLRTLAIHDGAENLLEATTSTTFLGMPCASGELTLFVEADNPSRPEEVRLNGIVVAGPADLFHANLGRHASLETIPVALQSGANTMELTTTDDHFGVHLAILSADGVQLAFEEEDDFATPLTNGQALSSPPEFGRLVSIAGSGANAGPAIFDTSPGGPNDPSQDRDLLVDRGHVLILQNSQAAAQSVPGFFDRPNDDPDGGELVLEFEEPLRPLCVVLVDIDAGTSQASSVRLTDTAGRQRMYVVPPRWTEDLLLDGPTGWRTLDLQTLATQPGFQSIATVAQSPGFDAANVIQLTVHLGSSGAIDDLVLASD